MTIHRQTTQTEYELMRSLIDRVRDDPADEGEAASTLESANDGMLSSAAFCAIMAYAAEQIPSVKDEALRLRRGCIDSFLPPVGTEVVLTCDVDRFPNFVAPKGLTGKITYVAEDFSMVRVLMDRPIPGAEEWENHLEFHDDDATQVHTSAVGGFLDSCEVVEAAPAGPEQRKEAI